jgi:hypothetical protein
MKHTVNANVPKKKHLQTLLKSPSIFRRAFGFIKNYHCEASHHSEKNAFLNCIRKALVKNRALFEFTG